MLRGGGRYCSGCDGGSGGAEVIRYLQPARWWLPHLGHGVVTGSLKA